MLSVRAVSFLWGTVGDSYTSENTVLTVRPGETTPFTPAAGATGFPPHSGLYYYEMHVTTDNAIMGLCSNPQQMDLHGDLRENTAFVGLHLQTGVVHWNGAPTQHRLWWLITPVSGGCFGFTYNSSTGGLVVHLNGEYMGVVCDRTFGLANSTVYPCVALANTLANNRRKDMPPRSVIVMSNPAPPF